jgi:hypothetical protein
MFSVEERRRVSDRLIERASADTRVVAAAIVGSLAGGRGKGLDGLPAELLQGFAEVRPRSLDRAELRRALTAAVEALLQQTEEVAEVAEKVAPTLREVAGHTS